MAAKNNLLPVKVARYRRPFILVDGKYYVVNGGKESTPAYEWFELSDGWVRAKYVDDVGVYYFTATGTWLRWADTKLRNGVAYRVINDRITSTP